MNPFAGSDTDVRLTRDGVVSFSSMLREAFAGRDASEVLLVVVPFEDVVSFGDVDVVSFEDVVSV